MSSIQPPQPPPHWTPAPEEILSQTKAALALDKSVEDGLLQIPEAELDFESVFLPLALAEARFETTVEPLSFLQNVSPDKAIRDASNKAEVLVQDYGVESSMRLDVFKVKVAAEKNIKANGQWEKLTSEEQRLVTKMLLDGTRAGLALPDKEREQLMALKKELSQTTVAFSKNFNEENGSVSFTAEELTGVPSDVVSGYKKRTDNGKELFQVSFKTPDIMPVFKYAQNPDVRRRAHEGFEARLAINVPLLDKALELRRKIASLLGYKTWADYVTEVKMIKTGNSVVEFLNDLEAKLKPVGEKERNVLLALKEEECKAKGIPFDGIFWIHDYRYYDRLLVEKTLDLDDDLVKQYFPVSVVIPTILEIYQKMFKVRFEELKDGKLWHSDAQEFAVWEEDAKDGSGFIGYCYLDLFPRDFKYSHAAVWGLLPGHTKADGSRSYPLASMVANLAKPTADRPALMRHDDVVTFFHEMGHVFHGLLSNTKFARFHGTSVARDFVEAPSQMLENWCWEPKVLQQMSSHYETKQPMPEDLITKLIKSRHVNVGLFYLRQVFFATFDIKVHTSKGSADYTALWNSLREEISLVKGGKPGPGQGSFAHITGGYDAGYYGYTYSLVFAADMYATVFKKDPLDPKLGQLYRDKILRVGGSREELESLTDFLGRPPNSDAFLKELFGSTNANL